MSSYRRNEFNNLIVRVIGLGLNDDGDEIRHTYMLDDLSAEFKKVVDDFTTLKDFIFELPEEASRKYLRVGVLDTKIHVEKKKTFVHFTIAFLLRVQESIKTTNAKKNYKVKTITLEDGEYQYVTGYATVCLSDLVIVMDSRCHNGPTAFLLRTLLLPKLEPLKYGFTTTAQIEDTLRVSIHSQLDKNYERMLRDKYKDLTEIGISVVKPKTVGPLAKVIKVSDKSQEVYSALGKVFNFLSGEDPDMDELKRLPFKYIRVKIGIDDANTEAKAIRKIAKDNLPEFVKSEYIDRSTLIFKSDNDRQLERAILKGIAISEEVKVEPKYYLNQSKMWPEQRRFYFEQV